MNPPSDRIDIESTRDPHGLGAACLLRWGTHETYAPVADVRQTAEDLLHISEDTVKTHLRRVFNRIGARSRAHAVALLASYGLLDMLGVRPAPEPGGRVS